MADVDVLPTAAAKETLLVRHDGFAMALHWATALLVVTLFGLAQIWGFMPRGSALRHGMQSVHISLGLALAVVFLLRVIWRSTGSRAVPRLATGAQHVAALAVHLALYGLLAMQIVLGFLFRWSHGPVGFFGLFAIPSPFVIGKAAHHLVGALHDDVAWIIIILAGGHAAMALAHHYILRDHTLRRMLPRSALR